MIYICMQPSQPRPSPRLSGLVQESHTIEHTRTQSSFSGVCVCHATDADPLGQDRCMTMTFTGKAAANVDSVPDIAS